MKAGTTRVSVFRTLSHSGNHLTGIITNHECRERCDGCTGVHPPVVDILGRGPSFVSLEETETHCCRSSLSLRKSTAKGWCKRKESMRLLSPFRDHACLENGRGPQSVVRQLTSPDGDLPPRSPVVNSFRMSRRFFKEPTRAAFGS